MKTKKGFTLVELVIVIAVIAILAAVLIPTFAGIIERARESSRLQVVTNARDEFYSANEQIVSPNQMEGYIFVVDEHVYQIVDGQVKNVDLTFTANYVTEQGNEVTGDFISNSEINIFEPLETQQIGGGNSLNTHTLTLNVTQGAEMYYNSTYCSQPVVLSDMAEQSIAITYDLENMRMQILDYVIQSTADTLDTVEILKDGLVIATLYYSDFESESTYNVTLDDDMEIVITFNVQVFVGYCLYIYDNGVLRESTNYAPYTYRDDYAITMGGTITVSCYDFDNIEFVEINNERFNNTANCANLRVEYHEGSDSDYQTAEFDYSSCYFYPNDTLYLKIYFYD